MGSPQLRLPGLSAGNDKKKDGGCNVAIKGSPMFYVHDTFKKWTFDCNFMA